MHYFTLIIQKVNIISTIKLYYQQIELTKFLKQRLIHHGGGDISVIKRHLLALNMHFIRQWLDNIVLHIQRAKYTSADNKQSPSAYNRGHNGQMKVLKLLMFILLAFLTLNRLDDMLMFYIWYINVQNGRKQYALNLQQLKVYTKPY